MKIVKGSVLAGEMKVHRTLPKGGCEHLSGRGHILGGVGDPAPVGGRRPDVLQMTQLLQQSVNFLSDFSGLAIIFP